MQDPLEMSVTQKGKLLSYSVRGSRRLHLLTCCNYEYHNFHFRKALSVNLTLYGHPTFKSSQTQKKFSCVSIS